MRRDGQDVAHGSGNDRVDYVTPFHLRVTPWVFDADPKRPPGDDPAQKTERVPPEPAPPGRWTEGIVVLDAGLSD